MIIHCQQGLDFFYFFSSFPFLPQYFSLHLAELAFNYVADATAKKTSGVFAIDDVPYKPETTTCEDHLDGITPVAGIDGWVALPSNDYKFVMNALAKVSTVAII